MLDTPYKTMLSQLLLKYRKSRLESNARGVCHVSVRYDAVASAVTSLIQIQPVWRQHSEGEEPEALIHCVLLLWIFSIPLTCKSSTVWSGWQKWAATGFFCFSCSYVRAVSVHPHMEGVLHPSNILQAAILA